MTFDSYDTDTTHTIVCDGGVFSLDGVTSDEWNLSDTSFVQTDTVHNLYLFGHNVNNGNPSSYLSSIRLYSCKIWEDGELVRDMVPVQRVYDVKCGLLDNVATNFYGYYGPRTDFTAHFSSGLLVILR